MISLRRIVSIGVAALLLVSAAAASAQDTTPGAFNLTILEDGASFEDVFFGLVGTKLYGFQGVEGDVVSVTMTQISEDLDPYLVVLGPNGEVIAADDDSGTEPLFAASITDVTLPATGSYFIIASTFYNIDAILEEEIRDEQRYTLTLTGNSSVSDAEVDPALLVITATEAMPGQTFNGDSTAESVVDYYLLSATEGDSLDLIIESADFDTVIHLFDNEGNRLAVNDDDDVRAVLNSALYDFVAPYTGSYLVLVTDVFFYNALLGSDELLVYTGGTYELSITAE